MGTVVLADVAELTTVKISELDETLSTGNDDDVPIVKDSKTQRVKKPNLVHTQNTDTILDEGGANEISVTEIPKMATAEISYYIAPDGDDSTGDGTTENPFASGQHAIDLIPKVLNGHRAYIYWKDGIYKEGNIEVKNFIDGALYLFSNSFNADSVIFEVPVDKSQGFNLNLNTAYIYLAAMSVKIQKNNGTCILCSSSLNTDIEDIKVGDNGNTGTKGIRATGSSAVYLASIADIDANKVAIGISAAYGGRILYDTNSFGDTFTDISLDGLITDSIVLSKADYDDAITKKHTQLCEAADFTKLDKIEAEADVTPDHDDLNNLNVGDYQHLLAAEYTELSNWLDNVTLGSDGLTSVPEMVLTPRASALSDVVGGMYFSSIDKSVYCCTEI